MVYCSTCGNPINYSIKTDDGKYCSCPDCSFFSGQHIFYPYPAGFTNKKGNVQHNCIYCSHRGAEKPDSSAVTCKDLLDYL